MARALPGPYAPDMTVIYDADCGVCQASVAWLRKRDHKGVFHFVGNDSEELPQGVTREETEHTMVVLDGARKLVRADGVAHVLRELPRWTPVAALLRVPGLRNVANWGYDRFARNRHRVSAALGMRVCAIPDRRS